MLSFYPLKATYEIIKLVIQIPDVNTHGYHGHSQIKVPLFIVKLH